MWWSRNGNTQIECLNLYSSEACERLYFYLFSSVFFSRSPPPKKKVHPVPLGLVCICGVKLFLWGVLCWRNNQVNRHMDSYVFQCQYNIKPFTSSFLTDLLLSSLLLKLGSYLWNTHLNLPAHFSLLHVLFLCPVHLIFVGSCTDRQDQLPFFFPTL